jgi:hypothetical protein
MSAVAAALKILALESNTLKAKISKTPIQELKLSDAEAFKTLAPGAKALKAKLKQGNQRRQGSGESQCYHAQVGNSGSG